MKPVSADYTSIPTHMHTRSKKIKAMKDEQAHESLPKHTAKIKSTYHFTGLFSAKHVRWQSARYKTYKTDVCLCKTKTKEVAEIGF